MSTVELQLRSVRMHIEAEHGAAQHNSYKSGIVNSADDLTALGDVVAKTRQEMERPPQLLKAAATPLTTTATATSTTAITAAATTSSDGGGGGGGGGGE